MPAAWQRMLPGRQVVRKLQGLYRGYVGIIGYILGIYWGYIGILEKKMETTIMGAFSVLLVMGQLRVQDSRLRAYGCGSSDLGFQKSKLVGS